MQEENPKLFISYSWSSPEHEQWVIRLATELCQDGVNVLLDKWDLKEGHDAHAFMERMVSDETVAKVAMICDQIYANKANARSGGVGTEAQIISPELYRQHDQEKFVAVISEKDAEGKPYLPIYYGSRIYIDLSDDGLYATNYEKLLRWIYDKPFYTKPAIGKAPSFLLDETATDLGTTTKFRRAIDAVRNDRRYSKGALAEYLSTLAGNLERFRIGSYEGEFDDAVIKSIEEFLPFRNEAIEVFIALAQYLNTADIHREIHRFFERIIPFLFRPQQITGWREQDSDNFRFIVHELFLYAIAIFLKYECFDAVSYLLRHRYYLGTDSRRNGMIPFSDIYRHIHTLEYRDQRLSLNRISLRADLLRQRCNATGLSFELFMQADFTLFMRNCIDCIRDEPIQSWRPETLLFADESKPFENYARGESKEYFDKLKLIFDISETTDFEPVWTAFREQKLRLPRGDWDYINPTALMGYARLASRP